MKKYYAFIRTAVLLIALTAASVLPACSGSGSGGAENPAAPAFSGTPDDPAASRAPLVPATGGIPVFRSLDPNRNDPTDSGGQD